MRSILAGVLRGVISQRLLPRVDGGRVAAVEVMVNNARIADLIRENRVDEIEDAIADGAYFKMQTFTQALIDLVLAGVVDRETRRERRRRTATTSSSRSTERSSSRRRRGAQRPRRSRRPSRAGELRLVARPRDSEAPRSSSPLVVAAGVRRRRARAADASRSSRAPSRCRAPTPRTATSSRSRRAGRAPPAQPVAALLRPASRRLAERGRGYGVPWNVLAAINKIESNFGRNMGPSSAGAIGWMQFMPSTWLRWGTDADGNGVADPWNPVDAVYSAARYLAASRRRDRHPPGRLLLQPRGLVRERGPAARAAVRQLGPGGCRRVPEPSARRSGRSFALDRLQAQLDDARAAVAKASDAYRAALDKAQDLAEHASRSSTARADAAPLLSDRLDAAEDAPRRPVPTPTARRRRRTA